MSDERLRLAAVVKTRPGRKKAWAALSQTGSADDNPHLLPGLPMWQLHLPDVIRFRPGWAAPSDTIQAFSLLHPDWTERAEGVVGWDLNYSQDNDPYQHEHNSFLIYLLTLL